MSQPAEPYGASSGYTESLPLASSGNEPPASSGNPGGTDYQKMVAAAMSSSEFNDTFAAGIPIRRQGSGLRIGYDSAMEMLGFGRADGDSVYDD